ncbi:hypothetical protein A3H16_02950 [Candidatus Kaiserbacteria bacterium RIFCSPLOWO2_12_FULL_53_8]|uniref:Uncharacterized protein n=2 Tax=Candidatus Kaiseribacteriota TaxID=1752734 RepID=A0A1F6CWT3_9BACT|nr:MAG: hypothetical protein A2851_01920 [Candidatus Kaiserbacteria bacterium RIFCSPHIGHO2_01_FULL_53_29]OGG90912.1 MAG: hypothetical protein A3H16_02950 [Candidatus Kaiserbacteria bacterium RIFCSPLOWO2_12_FULL_53_8]
MAAALATVLLAVQMDQIFRMIHLRAIFNTFLLIVQPTPLKGGLASLFPAMIEAYELPTNTVCSG